MEEVTKTAGATAPATLEEALARIAELEESLAQAEESKANLVKELEALKAAKPEVKEAPKAAGFPKVTIAKGPHKGEYEITAPYVLIPGIPEKVSAEALAADPAMVEELIKIESGIIQKIK